MRIIFMGTPDFAVPILNEIIGQGHDVAAVYTRAPKPAGRRGLDLTPSPVQRSAEIFSLPVFTPKSLRDPEVQRQFDAHRADCAVVVAYGLILPKGILEAPRLGCLNLHGSLLPRWRGAAPIQRAIMAGDGESGVMVMRMDEGLDTGPIAMAERVAIGPDMTGGELHDRLMGVGADLMGRALRALEREQLTFEAQPEQGATYAAKIDKSEARIDFRANAEAVHNLVRALAPFPGAFVEVDFGRGLERLKILRTQLARDSDPSGVPGALMAGNCVACGEGVIKILQVQRAGKGPVSFEDFLRGAPDLRRL